MWLVGHGLTKFFVRVCSSVIGPLKTPSFFLGLGRKKCSWTCPGIKKINHLQVLKYETDMWLLPVGRRRNSLALGITNHFKNINLPKPKSLKLPKSIVLWLVPPVPRHIEFSICVSKLWFVGGVDISKCLVGGFQRASLIKKNGLGFTWSFFKTHWFLCGNMSCNTLFFNISYYIYYIIYIL